MSEREGAQGTAPGCGSRPIICQFLRIFEREKGVSIMYLCIIMYLWRDIGDGGRWRLGGRRISKVPIEGLVVRRLISFYY